MMACDVKSVTWVVVKKKRREKRFPGIQVGGGSLI